MPYLSSTSIDKLGEKEYVYVNRNALNSQIAAYEIQSAYEDIDEELKILLNLWQETYKSEIKTKRIIPLIKMTSKDIKQCFKNYKTMPKGTFYKYQSL